jgi:hypothetical protein
MAYGKGTVEIDFGAHPGSNEASVVITGQADIKTTSELDCYIMADDSTTDHTTLDHRYVGIFATFTGGNIVAATGFTIYGRSIHKLTGKFKIRFAWAD